MPQSTKLTVQIIYEDGSGNNVEKVNTIDYTSDPLFVFIDGEGGGIMAKKSDVKRVFYVRPAAEELAVDQMEAMKAEDS
jgi:hypothetical protein